MAEEAKTSFWANSGVDPQALRSAADILAEAQATIGTVDSNIQGAINAKNTAVAAKDLVIAAAANVAADRNAVTTAISDLDTKVGIVEDARAVAVQAKTDAQDALAGFNLGNWVPVARTINGKPLSSNVTLGRADIADFAHTHDDRYYTEAEVNTLIAGVNSSIATKAALAGSVSQPFAASDINLAGTLLTTLLAGKVANSFLEVGGNYVDIGSVRIAWGTNTTPADGSGAAYFLPGGPACFNGVPWAVIVSPILNSSSATTSRVAWVSAAIWNYQFSYEVRTINNGGSVASSGVNVYWIAVGPAL